MDKMDLSVKEICTIIEKCKKAGVSELAFGSMTVKFHPRRNEDAFSQGHGKDQTQPLVSDFSEADETAAKLMDENTLLEAEEAQLLIDDPYAFERNQIARDIERQRVSNGKAHN